MTKDDNPFQLDPRLLYERDYENTASILFIPLLCLSISIGGILVTLFLRSIGAFAVSTAVNCGQTESETRWSKEGGRAW